MRFYTKVILNNQVVSKGYGRNKKASKSAAVQILLQCICPKMYNEWQQYIVSEGDQNRIAKLEKLDEEDEKNSRTSQ